MRSLGPSSRPPSCCSLAINVFPLIWTIQLSFTNYRANRPNAVVRNMGLENYRAILTDPDVWGAMQATAHFVLWTILLQTVIGFALAWLIDRKFRGHGFWTTVILVPNDAFAGGGRELLDFPLPAADRPLQLYRLILLWPAALLLRDDRIGQSGAVVHHHRRYLDVDPLCHADMSGGSEINPGLHLRGCRDRSGLAVGASSSRSRLPMALPFIMLAVLFRGIENFKMFDLVNLLTNGGPGSTTEVASITLKREAFEKWRTGLLFRLRDHHVRCPSLAWRTST